MRTTTCSILFTLLISRFAEAAATPQKYDVSVSYSRVESQDKFKTFGIFEKGPVPAGGTASLTCSVGYMGEYEITWFFDKVNGEIAKGDSNLKTSCKSKYRLTHCRNIGGYDDWTLDVPNASYSDEGSYTCKLRSPTDPSLQMQATGGVNLISDSDQNQSCCSGGGGNGKASMSQSGSGAGGERVQFTVNFGK